MNYQGTTIKLQKLKEMKETELVQSNGTTIIISNGNTYAEKKNTEIKKVFVEIGMPDEEQWLSQEPILRKFLAPLLMLMKIFGLYYEKNIANKIYAYFMLLLLLAMLAQSVAGLFYVQHTSGYYAVAVEILFKMKCIGQAASMIYICLKKTFWNLVFDIGHCLSSINICKCSQREKYYSSVLWRWLIFFIFFVVFCIVMNVFMMLFPTAEYEQFESIQMKPFAVTTVTRILKMISIAIMLAAWFLPVALCGMLSQSMFYLFDEFYRYMKTETGDICDSSKLCVKRFIKEIRKKFFKLSELSGRLDSMFGNILMISYLTDVCLLCFVLRLVIYSFTGVWGKVYILSFLIAPLFSLLSLSHHASKLYDKGQKMTRYVQFFNTKAVTLEAKIQFDMLLFHLNTEPVVMTIWKMIPLYRSIVISIFVSIITYFALLISLL